jgi:hypothetical protein
LNFNKKIWILIVLGSLLRICVAGSLELGNDEVYYLTYARHLQWNYFDHPPGVALLIRLSTFNLFFHHELFTRLGSIICSAAGTWLIFKTGSRISNPRAGWIAALLYNTSFYSSIIAGTFILPDSPQLICWLLAIYFMIGISENKSSVQDRALAFVLLGVSAGLCIMSKVHGVFLWIGLGGYVVFQRRDLLRSPMLWISGLITLIIIFPIYRWNLDNHFITYHYHQSRISFWGNKPDADRLLQQLLGSVFYSNPVNFVIYICCLLAIARNKFNDLPKIFPLLLWLSLPLILVLLWTSLFNDTLPHWSGPAYLSLMLLAACWLDGLPDRLYSKWINPAIWVYVTIVLIGTICIRFLPFSIGSAEETNLGKGDITLDMTGWRSFSVQFDSLYEADIQSGKMKPSATLISDYWFPAAHFDYYCAIPFHRNLLVFGPVNDIHHFAWLNQMRPRLNKGADAYFIYVSNYSGPPKSALKNLFEKVEEPQLIPQYRMGKRVRNFVVYRMFDYKGDSSDYLIPGIQ